MIKSLFLGFVIIHATIHLRGFLQAFKIAEFSGLTLNITRAYGILWLCAALLFFAVAISLLLKNGYWWKIAVVALILSQILIFAFWHDAKFGLLPNLIVLLAVILSLGSLCFERSYKEEALSSLQQITPTAIVTEAELRELPQPLQKYLHYVGVVGKPKVRALRVVLSGEMRQKGKDYFPFIAEQYNFYDEPTRLFFMKARIMGITVPGYHRYRDGKARMDVRLFGLVAVASHEGEKMDAADTVTLFNDMCLFAPATLLDKRITWKPIDEMTVKAIFTNRNITISAILHFNGAGQLINFVSEDRWDVAAMKRYRFSTPISKYRSFKGYNLPAYGEAVWHYPDGDFTYGRIEINNVEYNEEVASP
ncbi:MAG: hypothetical protein K9K75_04555 [Deltaproteobacteria bacterium]|nr:hypothetical protein [Deltaproteobacteria bacterium]